MEYFTAEERRGVVTVKLRDAKGRSISSGTRTFTFKTLDPP